MKNIIIYTEIDVDKVGGTKSSNDLLKIFKKMNLEIKKFPLINYKNPIIRLTKKLLSILRLIIYLSFKDNNLYIFIYPFLGENQKILKKIIYKLLNKGNNRTCAFVMDLNCARFKGLNNIDKDIESLNLFNYIIAHNDRMKKFLIENGIKQDKIFVFEMFDNIVDDDMKLERKFSRKIVFAGNLGKSNFLNKLCEDKKILYSLNLYGIGLKRKLLPSFMNYKGAFSTERIVYMLDGSFGLIWDGDSVDTCTGFLGEYTKINNPGKFPLYIAAGLPVIVWKGAAVAETVKKYKIGIIIDSLMNIDKALDTITEDEYKEMCNNVLYLRKKVITGYHYEKVIKEVINNNKLNYKENI